MIYLVWLSLSLLTYLFLKRHQIWQNNRLGAYLMIIVSPIGLLAFILDVAADKYEQSQGKKTKGEPFKTYHRKNNQDFNDFIDGL